MSDFWEEMVGTVLAVRVVGEIGGGVVGLGSDCHEEENDENIPSSRGWNGSLAGDENEL